MDNFKVCNKCQTEKKLSEFGFCSDRVHYLNTCKRCWQDRANELKRIKRRQKNPEQYKFEKMTDEEIKAHKKSVAKIWRENNIERVRECSRKNQAKYRKENKNNFKEKRRILKLKWEAENKDHTREYKKKYRQDHLEQERERRRLYLEKNREKRKLWNSRSFKKNWESIKDRDWYFRQQFIKRFDLLNKDEIPPELLESYKLYVKLKREVRNVKTNCI